MKANKKKPPTEAMLPIGGYEKGKFMITHMRTFCNTKFARYGLWD